MKLQDADNDALDRYIAGASELSRLYREAGTEEPRAALDDAIMTAARNALVARSGKLSFLSLRSWQIPVSLAATLLLTFTLTVLVREEGMDGKPPVMDPVQIDPVQMDSAPASAAPTASETRQPSDEFLKEENTSTVKRLPAPSPAPSPAMGKQALPQQPAGPQEKEAKSTASMPAEESQQRASAVAAEADSPQAESVDDRAVVDAPAPALEPVPEFSAPAPAKTESAPSPTGPVLERSRRERDNPVLKAPADWLIFIRELRQQGRHAEAAKNLGDFKQRYPEYPLPKDLE